MMNGKYLHVSTTGVSYKGYSIATGHPYTANEVKAFVDEVEAGTLYRRHRGSLADSLKTCELLQTFEDLEAHLTERCPWMTANSVIKVEEYGASPMDERIGWHTHLVTIDGIPVGFCNKMLTKAGDL